MTVKFKASTMDGAGSYEGTAVDMGLCLVTAFVIDGIEFYSVAPNSCTPGDRMKIADNDAATFGYKIIRETIEASDE